MASDKEMAALARLILIQKDQIEAASMMLAAHSRLLSKLLTQCAGEDCDRLALVCHIHTDIKMCERCAAKVAIAAAKSFVAAEPGDVLNPVRGTLMNEGDWRHLPDAMSIRIVQEYVDALNVRTDVSVKEVEGMN